MELQTEYTVSAIGFQLKSLVFSIFPILFYMKIVFKNVLSHHKKNTESKMDEGEIYVNSRNTTC